MVGWGVDVVIIYVLHGRGSKSQNHRYGLRFFAPPANALKFNNFEEVS